MSLTIEVWFVALIIGYILLAHLLILWKRESPKIYTSNAIHLTTCKKCNHWNCVTPGEIAKCNKCGNDVEYEGVV